MTLPASGAITMAQVNTEINISPSTTAITLNNTAVRRLANKTTAGSAVTMDDLHGKSNNWIETVASLSAAGSVDVDSSGNIYMAGSVQVSSLNYAYVQKTNALGDVVWAKQYSTSNTGFSKVRVDSSGNIYCAGALGVNGFAVKFDTNGNILWQKGITLSPSVGNIYDIAFDSSGNVHFAFSLYASGTGQASSFVQKWDPTGTTLLWSNGITKNSSSNYVTGIVVDSSDNVYFGSYTSIAKLNSSGTLQWQKTINASGAITVARLAVDSSNNIYCVGGSAQAFIFKLDSSGAILWQKACSFGTNGTLAMGVNVDSSNNIYTTGLYNISTNVWGLMIHKFDTSGTVAWQVQFDGPAFNAVYYAAYDGICFDTLGNVYAGGVVYSTNIGVYIKMPNTASKQGTYSVGGLSIVYGTTSLSYSTSAYTISSSTWATSTYTASSTPAGTVSSYSPTTASVGMT